MYIGELINKYREKNSLSMQEFANRSGLSKAYIGMLEKIINPTTGKPISPSLPKMQAIAAAMNLTLDELLPQLDSDQEVTINTAPEGYYTDQEAAEYAEYARTNPDIRVLFSAAKDISKKDMEKAVEYIEFLKAKERSDYRFSDNYSDPDFADDVPDDNFSD